MHLKKITKAERKATRQAFHAANEAHRIKRLEELITEESRSLFDKKTLPSMLVKDIINPETGLTELWHYREFLPSELAIAIARHAGSTLKSLEIPIKQVEGV